MERKDRIDWADVSDVESSRESREKHLTPVSKPAIHSSNIFPPSISKSTNNQLVKSINAIDSETICLCLLGVAYEASLDDIQNYFEDIGAPIIRFIHQKNKKVYVVRLTKQNALKAVQIQHHILINRQFIIRVDREKHGQQRNKTKYSNQGRQKSDYRKSRTSSTIAYSECKAQIESQLMTSFKDSKISEQNLQIIALIKAKNSDLLTCL